MESTIAYIPADRRLALASGTPMPEHVRGAALFADISGFTPLTEALTETLGLRRGAEELPRYLMAIWDALIAEVDAYAGTVIGFAGDAVTCWFDDELPMRLAPGVTFRGAAQRATACALAMQRAMQQFAAVTIPGRPPVTLAVKVAVAAGEARRFVAGDPAIQVFDILAGETLWRMSAAEHQATRGEVVVDEPCAAALGDLVQIGVWREEELATGERRRFALVGALREPVPPSPWPPLEPGALAPAVVRPWLLAQVYERLEAGMGEFLTELRPSAALFLRFSGIDYDHDDTAGLRLDDYVRRVQRTLAACDGTLIDITIGDKGSYLYMSFGAPVAHEDDPRRAVNAALALRSMTRELGNLAPLQMGISRGTMRTGAYGGATRRTYGVLGDDVNLAARLMGQAGPDEILISGWVHKTISGDPGLRAGGFTFEPRPPIKFKGKAEPLPIFAITGIQQRRALRLQEPTYGLPMVGRSGELKCIQERLALAAQGRGQVVGITAEAGMGKSRLAAEAIRAARALDFTCYGGACQSDGTQTPYLVWKPIWQAFFDVDPDAPLRRRIRNLEGVVDDWAPERIDAVPLLGPLLELPLPDNDFTTGLEPKHRRSALEALLLDCLKAGAAEAADDGGGILLVLEDVHWIDATSHDLLERVARAIADLPVLVLLAYRPADTARLTAPRVEALPYFTRIGLQELGPLEAEQAVRAKLGQLYPEWRGAVPRALIERVIRQAQGNPFYAEEVLNYLHDRDYDLRDEETIARLELPSSLRSLILSRIDQLSARQQLTIKVASILGRVFSLGHLAGYYPALGKTSDTHADLNVLAAFELTPLESADPELTYLFKHLVTHEVAYEDLPYATRAVLHEQYARFVEVKAAGNGDEDLSVERYLDLLAYHYERSENLAKKCEYLLRAAAAAQARYANEAALDYYRRVQPLLPASEQAGVWLKLGQVLELTGKWGEAGEAYTKAMACAEGQDCRPDQARCLLASSELARKQGHFSEAAERLAGAQTLCEESADEDGVAQVLHTRGTLAAQQGDYAGAGTLYDASLAIRRRQGDQSHVASLLSNLGIVARFQGDLGRARALHEEALAIRRGLGDRWAIGVSLNNLGNVALDQGLFDEARRLQEEGLAVRREVGDMWAVANALNNLANLARSQGDYAGARTRYHESLKIAREFGDRWALAYLLEDMGCLAACQGQARQALCLAGAAEAIRATLGSPRSAAEQGKLDCDLDRACQALGPEDAARAAAEGQAMTLEQALQKALEI